MVLRSLRKRTFSYRESVATPKPLLKVLMKIFSRMPWDSVGVMVPVLGSPGGWYHWKGKS